MCSRGRYPRPGNGICVSKENLGSKLLNGGADLLDIGSNNSLDLLAVLEEKDGGHVSDSHLGADIRDLVDVNLEEVSILKLSLKLVQKRSNHLAGSAPGSVEVDNGKTRELSLLLELRKRSNFLDHGDFRCGE